MVALYQELNAIRLRRNDAVLNRVEIKKARLGLALVRHLRATSWRL